jgi:uncharacterized protein involved in outer membrane biogenesis
VSWRQALLRAAGVGAAVIAVGLLLLVARLDDIVQGLIERRASALTGTAVTLEEVSLGLGTGRATLRGLTVANPPGFRAVNALALDEVEVRIDLRSLLADPLVIDTVRIVHPRVFYEVDAAGKANVDLIRRHVEARDEPRPPPPDGATPAPRPPRADRGRRLIIHLLELRQGEVTFDTEARGGTARTEELPPFELTAIGLKQGGATPAEVGRVILVAVARDVAVAVAANELEKVVGKHLGGALGGLIKKGGSGAIEQGLGEVLDKVLGGRKK